MDEARITQLNAHLPRTRAIGHGVVRDAHGRVLLCRLTYKDAWDLPGGVVEPHESPRAGCLREVREELGVHFAQARLLAVNWLPPWRGWDDANVFLFDLGVHEPEVISTFTLQTREIVSVHWCDAQEVARMAAGATARLLASIAGRDISTPLYLEDGLDATAHTGGGLPTLSGIDHSGAVTLEP